MKNGLEDRFILVGGTIAGCVHQLAGRGNQDALTWRQSPEALIAVVADGCSSGDHSEVGAQLVVRLLAEALQTRVGAGALPALAEDGEQSGEVYAAVERMLEEARIQVLGSLDTLLTALGGHPTQTVIDLLLCTALGLVVTPSLAVVFALGDGMVAVNGDVQRLGPYPDNAPPYLAYGLLTDPSATHQDVPRFTIRALLPTARVESLLVGTDGVVDLVAAAAQPLPGTNEPLGPLAQFWIEDRYLTNPDRVRRRLARANRQSAGRPGLLPDDTTLVLLRRKPDAAPV